jgi:thiol-disulfide isomerase/thioredoxin
MKKTFYFIPAILLSLFLFSCSKNAMVQKLSGHIKDLDGNFVTDEELKADYYFVMYGATWCPYCKEMKDEITDFYNTYKKKNNFIVVFAGCKKDKSNDDLTNYLKQEEYPFYYVDFDHRDECGLFKHEEYTKCEKFYIPGFILFDKNGKTLSNSNGPLKIDYRANRPLEYFKKSSQK